MRKFSGLVGLVSVIIFFGGSGPLLAEGKAPPLIKETLPVLLEEVEPRYPMTARAQAIEGWVHLNYRVNADGTVSDIEILDSTSKDMFVKEAIRAVKKMKYKPGTGNGKSISDFVHGYYVTFTIYGRSTGGSFKGIRSVFYKKYKTIWKKIEAGQYETARSEIDHVKKISPLNLYEASLMYIASAAIYEAQGDLEDAKLELERATVMDARYLEKNPKRGALAKLFTLQYQDKDYMAALETFTIIKENKRLKFDPEIFRAVDEIKTLQKGGQPFAVQAVIDKSSNLQEYSFWTIGLLKRTIGFQKGSGNIHSFRIACDEVARSSDYVEGLTWEIPKSWGDCRLFVYGDRGATFELVQY